MKLLLDENLSPAHALRLRQAGHDAIAIVEVGLCGMEDVAIRLFAINQQRILITLDADFGQIVSFPPAETPGVIWLRAWPPTESAIAALLDGAVRQLAELPLAGKLVIVEPGRIRIR